MLWLTWLRQTLEEEEEGMADDVEPGLRRSSSQASNNSSTSNKVKTVRIRPKKSLSSTANTPIYQEDPSLTSFPSLSPEQDSSSASRSVAAQGAADPARTGSQRVRDRKATLARLTNASPSLQGQRSLFDDSPRSSVDIPGALHLATDEHIERLIARSGPVKLVRQFAQDLAYRDAELSALRVRADERERELKKMLREVEVSSLDIERRLHLLENTSTGNGLEESTPEERPSARRKITNSIDNMMHQAMQEDLGVSNDEHFSAADLDATIKPKKGDRDGSSGATSTRKRAGSAKSWQNYVWGSGATSRKTSRSNSILSTDISGNPDPGDKLNAASNNSTKRKGLENLFAPSPQPSSSSYFIGGKKPLEKKPVQGDEASIASKKSERSISSLTVRLFAGNPFPGKDNEEDTTRNRSSSLKQEADSGDRISPSSGTSSPALTALKRVNSQPTSTPSKTSAPAKINSSTTLRAPLSNALLSTSPDTNQSDAHAANLGPVEMEAILPDDTKPPTMNSTYTYYNYTPSDMLTDRFGFIYDQRQRKRQREAAMAVKRAHRGSGTDSLRDLRLDPESAKNGDKGHRKTPSGLFAGWQRPATPNSIDEQQNEGASTKGWQDYLRLATRPTELLSHTPSTGAIVTLTVADSATGQQDTRSRASSQSSSAKNTTFPIISPMAEATPSPVTATSAEFAGTTNAPGISVSSAPSNDQEPVKLLLEQLTELHDNLQAERAVKWNEFLRKVRAERGAAVAAAASERQGFKGKMTFNMPEASLLDGEFIGVTNLGNKGKIGRAKWKEFKLLVLGGIPVSLRSKIWSECSGASALRIPGYYDDLVAASSNSSQSGGDAEVAAQIQADIHRTLTDNVFFRHGPGTTKLREVLLAYAHRNPTVGYCQGMNMIVGSLLLIMPTAEDAFWILVAMIENILPAHYYDHGLVTSRADQIVLREYVSEVLPRLSAHLEELNVELEAMTFQWFLSVFTDCLSAEALYRVWDVGLCLNSTDSVPPPSPVATSTPLQNGKSDVNTDHISNTGTGSTFLFQLALALLKLNENQLLACDNPASVYAYINHNMTNHAISIDGLIQASEGLRKVVQRDDVLEKRAKAIQGMTRR